MKLETTEGILEWATQQGYDGEHDTETAARLALAMRVLAIMERRAKTNDGSWVNAEVRNVWPEIHAEAAQNREKENEQASD